jgi:5-methyltetrahydrofolate--homocysteine methyltransferase
MSVFEELTDAIIRGDRDAAIDITRALLKRGAKPGDVLRRGLIKGMDVVGQRFKAYEMYLPEVIMSAGAMKDSMGLLKPHFSKTEFFTLGKIVMATIEGDVHDIGKNLVSMMLEGAGFEIFDLGVDVPIKRVIEKARDLKGDIIGISALLTTTMLGLERAIHMIGESAEWVKTMVGGAPLTHEYAEKIGADGFAPDALRAIGLAKSLLGK